MDKTIGHKTSGRALALLFSFSLSHALRLIYAEIWIWPLGAMLTWQTLAIPTRRFSFPHLVFFFCTHRHTLSRSAMPFVASCAFKYDQLRYFSRMCVCFFYFSAPECSRTKARLHIYALVLFLPYDLAVLVVFFRVSLLIGAYARLTCSTRLGLARRDSTRLLLIESIHFPQNISLTVLLFVIFVKIFTWLMSSAASVMRTSKRVLWHCISQTISK